MPTFPGMKKGVLEIDKFLTILEQHFRPNSIQILVDVKRRLRPILNVLAY